MGFLLEHPIRFRCGNCGISLEGKFSNDGISFRNGIVVNDVKDVDYVIASSGELLTSKLEKVENPLQIVTPSPFINACMIMGNDGYQLLKEKILNVFKFRDEFAYTIQNINDLYFRSTHKSLLEKEIRKILPEDCFPTKTELDILRAVHHLNIIPFITVMNDDFDSISNLISKKFVEILKNNRSQLDSFARHLFHKNLLNNWEKQISVMYSQMLQQLNRFIPIIGSRLYKMTLEQIESNYAITTVSFEEVQQLYVNLYEIIADMLPLAIGIDNILERNDYNMLKAGHSIKKRSGELISTLEELFSIKEKGTRISYIDGTGVFDKLISGKLDKNVRNAIGHFNYDNEDVFNQTIKFKHLSNTNRIVEKSLIRVCIEIWDMYLCLFSLSELVYNLKRAYFESQGITASSIKSMSFNFPALNKVSQTSKKIGRNEPCPCGSGKKYKKCCGFNN